MPRQLPAAAPRFAGRAAELEVLTGLLDEGGGTVVISAIGGTAGVGKTALAVQWAHQVAGRFPDGQLYVNLRGFGPSAAPVSATEAVRLFLDSLGVTPERVPAGLDAQAALYRSLLSGKKMLIVADNARDAGQVRPLLPGAPGCLVLVTSRNQLTGLAVADGAQLLTLDVLAEAEARDLLAQRLGRVRIAGEPAAVAELTRLCAGLPLALSIAAARAAAQPRLPLASLVAELRGARARPGSTDAGARLDALGTGDTATDVRTVFSWSCQQLTGRAARMFRLLGVHPGPDITVPAAASLAGQPLPQARAAVAELARAHLITEHIPGRFAFHDLLRAYAIEQAGANQGDAGQRAAVHRLLDHYLHTSYSGALQINHGMEPLALEPPVSGVTPEKLTCEAEAMAWFGSERAVLMSAIALARATGSDGHAWILPGALADFFKRRGHWHDWASTQRVALAAADRRGDPAWRARAHRSLGTAYTYLGAHNDARRHLRRALSLYSQLGDGIGQARVHQMLGLLFEREGRYRLSLNHASRCLSLARASGRRAEQAIALNTAGWYHAQLGEYDQALALCRQALGLLQGLGDLGNEAATWDTIGYALQHLGQHAGASAAYNSALSLFRANGDRYYQASTLIHLGDAHSEAGSLPDAHSAWREAVAILDDLNHPDADGVRSRLAGHAAGSGASVRSGTRTRQRKR